MNLLNIFSSLQRMASHINKYGGEGYRIWKSKQIKDEKIVQYKLKGLQHPLFMRTGTSDYAVFKQVFIEEQYEFPLKTAPKVIIDCGANIGLASVYYANKYPHAKIVAVEPETTNFELLKKNTEKYGNIACVKSGIWGRKANLVIENTEHGNWGFITKEVDYCNEQTLSAISIDDIMRDYAIDKIDILKVDIEGSEKEMFEAENKSWLKKTSLIIIEFHDNMKQGTAHSFFHAIDGYNYNFFINGENIFCELN